MWTKANINAARALFVLRLDVHASHVLVKYISFQEIEPSDAVGVRFRID